MLKNLVFYIAVLWLMGTLSVANAQNQSFGREDLDRLDAAHIQAQMRVDALEARAQSIPLAPREVEARLVNLGKEIAKHNQNAQNLNQALAEKQRAYETALATYKTQEGFHKDTVLHLIVEGRAPPPPPLALDDAAGAIRTIAVLSAIRPKIISRMVETQTAINALIVMQADISKAREIAFANQRVLDVERKELEALIALKREQFTKRRNEVAAARADVETIAIKAQTLRKLIANIEANAPPPPSVRTQPAPSRQTRVSPQSFRGLKSPLSGPIIRRFGEKDSTGLAAKGIYISGQPNDLVVAPIGGVVVFAKAYRGFGQMVIMRVSENQHVVMHGMENLFAEFGEKLQTGQPIGRMPPANGQTTPILYLETRNKAGPTNPSKWLKSQGN